MPLFSTVFHLVAFQSELSEFPLPLNTFSGFSGVEFCNNNHFYHQGAEDLVLEVEHKLGEMEKQCRDSVQAFWEECRPCLEEACKNFYTSTCRRSFSAFTNRVLRALLSWPYNSIGLAIIWSAADILGPMKSNNILVLPNISSAGNTGHYAKCCYVC